MKKLLALMLAAMLVLFAACERADVGDGGTSGGDESAQNDSAGENQTMRYEEGGLSFDVPASWSKNFKSVTREVGSGTDMYEKTDFMYTEGERDIIVMSVGRFTKDQWEKLKQNEPAAEDAKLGESKNGEYVYSIFYENHDYIEDEELRETLKKVREEATSLRSTINID